MKLRIQGNALRLRLNRPEVQTLVESGAVEERIAFPNNSCLTYALQANPDISAPAAHFENGNLRIIIPSSWAAEWSNSDRVGFHAELTLSEGSTLNILIEKDFQCLNHRPGEDETQNYPNPAARAK